MQADSVVFHIDGTQHLGCLMSVADGELINLKHDSENARSRYPKDLNSPTQPLASTLTKISSGMFVRYTSMLKSSLA